MKTCCDCHEPKPTDDFHKGARRCKACQSMYHKAWYAQNREAVIGKVNDWRKDNRERVNALIRERRTTPEGREARRLAAQRYRAAHPEVFHTIKLRNRAKTAGVPSDFTAEQWAQVMNEANGRCSYCGQESPLTIDHIVPMSRGGANTLSNVVPVCLPCNSRKHTSTLEEWKQSLIDGARRRWGTDAPEPNFQYATSIS